MRDTIDFGIDLGTTNSAIAVVDGGTVSVLKSNENADFTPSAVWIPRPGTVHVGRAARDRMPLDPANAHAEFKQEMGLEGARRTFPKAGLELSPPELSAEVLKSLRADAAERFGEPPHSAVITVPAAFRLHENNATSKAAELAGLGECPLVQEPTAAAFAYGFQNADDDACWMVFDLGGGTFDAAVVSTHDGELKVLDHAGDPHLGGKLIDWAIVERLLAPAAAREFGLPDFVRAKPRWRGNFAKLKREAEDGKIALSRRAEVEVSVELNVDGRTLHFDHVLTRDDVDRIAEPYWARAIGLCRDALTKANLGTGDIDRLLLVGGATLAPGLRERLADPTEGLGITLDHSQDPTTVVARGAAVFAGTVPAPRAAVRPSAGQLAVDLRYPRTTSLTTVAVVGKVSGDARVGDLSGYRVMLHNPDGTPPFRTPQLELGPDGTFVAEVRVDEQSTSTFVVRVTSPSGGVEKVLPGSFSVTHWLNELGGQVLTNSIGLAEADGRFAALVGKGARLPATGRGTFYTSVPLRRTDRDAVIRVPIVEGEKPRADRNLQVGMIEIRPKDVRLDLPADSEVEITIEVDESRRVTVVAEVPLVDEQFEAEIDLSHVRPPDAVDLRREAEEVRRRFARLRESTDVTSAEDARRRLVVIEKEGRLTLADSEVGAATSDAGSAAAAEARLRELQSELDEVESLIDLPERLRELTEVVDECRTLVLRVGGPDDWAEFDRIERRVEEVRDAPDADAIDLLIRRTAELSASLMQRDGTLDVSVFAYFRQNQHIFTSPGHARSLIVEGERAVAIGDLRALAGVNQRLRALLPVDAPDPSQGGVVRHRNGGRWG